MNHRVPVRSHPVCLTPYSRYIEPKALKCLLTTFIHTNTRYNTLACLICNENQEFLQAGMCCAFASGILHRSIHPDVPQPAGRQELTSKGDLGCLQEAKHRALLPLTVSSLSEVAVLPSDLLAAMSKGPDTRPWTRHTAGGRPNA